MSSGFLPFDDDVEAPIVIRETVRLKPDTTGISRAVLGSVRL